MTMGRRAALLFAVLVSATVLAVPAPAGVLDENADALPGWSGSTPFANGNLNGYVDWAVFEAEDYPFSTEDWTPTPGQLVYAYQVFSTGTDAISSYGVPVINPAGNIGAFEDTGITGMVPSSSTLSVGNLAYWTFSGLTTNSCGLVYSSMQAPTPYYSIVVNGGHPAIAIPVPTPSNAQIPEPATCALMLLGLATMAFGRPRTR